MKVAVTTQRVLHGIVILLLLSFLLVVAQTAVAAEPVVVSRAPGVQSSPRTDGTTVVWFDFRDGDAGDVDLYAASLPDRREFVISSAPGSPAGMDIDNGLVVWAESMECHGCQRDVLAKDLSSGTTTVIAGSKADETQPAISWPWIVWQSVSNGTFSIHVRDVRGAGVPSVVAEAPAGTSIGAIAVDGDRVAWTEEHGNSWKILTATIGVAGTRLVADGTSVSGASFGMDLAGDVLVYVDSVSNLVARNLETDQTTTLAGAPYDRFPTTDGRYIYWLHALADSGGTAFDVWAYDLETGSRFPVTATTGQVNAVQVNEGLLVWSAGTDDDRDIYANTTTGVLPSAPRRTPSTTYLDRRFFPETGHSLAYGFKAFWEANGGLAIFGYPMTEEFVERNTDTGDVYTVQVTERQRFEYHPENAGTAYEVLLGRLGAELLVRQGRDWTTFPTADLGAAHYFPETDHAIAPEVWAYWSGHGLDFGDVGVSYRESLALFGFPLSEQMTETNVDGDTVLTQYFERAVFELHPDNSEPYRVLLRRLGAEVLAARGW